MSEIAHLLADAVPPLHVRTVEPLGEGDFCTAWLVNGTLVVRQAKHPEAGRALEREACLMPVLARRLPVQAPVPQVVSPDGSHGPVLALHGLIEGVELTRERWEELPEPRRSAAARDLGRFLRVLHDVEPELAAACHVPILDASARIEELRGMLMDPPGREWPAVLRDRLTEPLRTALLGAFESYLDGESGGSHEAALLHGDLSPGHVLIDPASRTLSGVIDWGDAMLCDPARDFIFLYEDWGRDFLRHALDGYGAGGDASFLRRILVLYLADQTEWTLQVAEDGRSRDVEQGGVGLERGVRDLAQIP